MKNVAVLQSNYLPWKGYFDIIHDVDLFIFHDDVQFTYGDWRNRNKIKTEHGLQWLTIPAGKHDDKLIYEVELSDNGWQRKHWNQIITNYSKAPYFQKYKEFFEDLYLGTKWDNLHQLNSYLIKKISREFLHGNTEFSDSREYVTHGKKHEKLLSLVKATGADVYLSGPAAKDYLIIEDYDKAGIKVEWKDYSGYPEYNQRFSLPFEHNVSIIDLLFNTGEDAPYYIWGWREVSNQ